jgi:hypothetical protein
MGRPNLLQIAVVGQLLDHVGRGRRRVPTTLQNVTQGDFSIAEETEHQGLRWIDVVDADCLEFKPDHVEVSTMQPVQHRCQFGIVSNHCVGPWPGHRFGVDRPNVLGMV